MKQEAQNRLRSRYNPPVLSESRQAGACLPALTFLTLFVSYGLGCAEVVERGDAGVRRDAAAVAMDGGTPDPRCKDWTWAKLAPFPPEVLLLLDRSESMGTAFGSSTRYQVVAALLSDIVTAYGAHVRFGYQELPGRQGCGEGLAACCASPPMVGVLGDNQTAVVSALSAATPLTGGTPLAAALRAARDYYGELDDDGGNRFVLLATDGAPNCTLVGALAAGRTPDDPACADALAQVALLAAAGVGVIVLGVGPDLANDTTAGAACLESLAQAGGMTASPGSPGYYAAREPEELAAAIVQILGAIDRPSCVLQLTQVSSDEVVDLGVFLDDQPIPQSPTNGWQSERNPWRVRITGEYCERILSLEVVKVEARYKCSVIP